MGSQVLQVATVLLALAGAWCLAFGLKIKRPPAGYTADGEEVLKVDPPDGTIRPTQTDQRRWLVWLGLALITAAAAIEVGLLCTG